ncbi:hypothetical protein TRVL_06115 [Trypanosoma vivax]|nr:hypothetical protein TRVL_06115 [Trypanosoma vivax]
MRAAFDAPDGENNGPKQRICQPEGQIQHELEGIKSPQETYGALAAENGLSKTGRVHAAMETRCASTQRSEHNTQQLQQCEGMLFHAPAAGEQKQDNNSPLTTNVGFRGVQVLPYKPSETSFKAEEKIRTYEGALEYLTATSPEHLLAARRGVFPMPTKPGFLLQDAWDETALWIRTVGEMGPVDGLNRLGRCAYNRRRLLRLARAHPGMQAESLAGALKGPRKEEGPHHHAHPKAQKRQTPVLSNARCFRCGRMGCYGSACYANMAREPYWKSKNLTALRHDGALYKMGRLCTRPRWWSNAIWARKFRRSWGNARAHCAATRHRAVPGTLGCRFEQLREVDGPHLEDARGMAKLPWAPPKAMGKDKVSKSAFQWEQRFETHSDYQSARRGGTVAIAVAAGEVPPQ